MHTLTLDDERIHLTVIETSYGLYTEPDLEGMVFHYDYRRHPTDQYPGAHLQVAGESETLLTLNKRMDQNKVLRDLHFPVGGKRYRPSLEDLVEFLIIEGYTKGRPGWADSVGLHREKYQRRQLMAAVRRDTEAAAEMLGVLDRRIE